MPCHSLRYASLNKGCVCVCVRAFVLCALILSDDGQQRRHVHGDVGDAEARRLRHQRAPRRTTDPGIAGNTSITHTKAEKERERERERETTTGTFVDVIFRRAFGRPRVASIIVSCCSSTCRDDVVHSSTKRRRPSTVALCFCRSRGR